MALVPARMTEPRAYPINATKHTRVLTGPIFMPFFADHPRHMSEPGSSAERVEDGERVKGRASLDVIWLCVIQSEKSSTVE